MASFHWMGPVFEASVVGTGAGKRCVAAGVGGSGGTGRAEDCVEAAEEDLRALRLGILAIEDS